MKNLESGRIEALRGYELVGDSGSTSIESVEYTYVVVFQHHTHGGKELFNHKVVQLYFKTKKEAYKAMRSYLNNEINALLLNRKKSDRTLDFPFKKISWFITEERANGLFDKTHRLILNAIHYVYK